MKEFSALLQPEASGPSNTTQNKMTGNYSNLLVPKKLGLECFATGMGQFPICKLKWDLLRTSFTACTIDRNTFSAPFGIFYVKTEI